MPSQIKEKNLELYEGYDYSYNIDQIWRNDCEIKLNIIQKTILTLISLEEILLRCKDKNRKVGWMSYDEISNKQFYSLLKENGISIKEFKNELNFFIANEFINETVVKNIYHISINYACFWNLRGGDKIRKKPKLDNIVFIG